MGDYKERFNKYIESVVAIDARQLKWRLLSIDALRKDIELYHRPRDYYDIICCVA